MTHSHTPKWTIHDECKTNRESIIDLYVGKKIGGGASRRVYELVGDSSRVMKVEHTGWSFHNQTEWRIWQEVKQWPIADWFAKCIDIDACGNILIQQRTVPFECEQDFREQLRKTRGGYLPTCFADTHYGNFGMLDGRVTCHDYGYHKFLVFGAERTCQELGYLEYDKPPPEVWTQRKLEVGQLALDL
jgi:hypothetical protein